MKKFLIGLLILGVQVAHAKDIPLVKTMEAGQTGVRLVSEAVTDDSVVLTLSSSVAKLSATTIKNEDGEFTYLTIPGYQQTGDIGSPSLRVMNRLLEVPLGAEVVVEVVNKSKQQVDMGFHGFMDPLYPRQPPRPKDGTIVPFSFDRRSYKASGFQQDRLVQVEELGMLRDMRLVLVKVAPVAYEPTSGTLEVTDKVEFRVRVQDPDMEATEAMKAKYHSPFFTPMRRNIIVPAAVSALETTAPKVRTYAIVADKALEAELAPFVTWKTEQGFDVILAWTEDVGATWEETQAYVHGLYNNPADGHGAPDFLLLVGDHDNLPAKQCGSGWGGHISDLYFAAVTDDYLPDILYGRFSARNAGELVPQIQKIMEYEKYEFADPSFLEHVVLVAGWDSSHAVEWGWPQIKYGMEYYFNAEHGIPNVSEFLSAGAHQNESDIKAAVGTGASFFNYTAHGSNTSFADPSFTIPDVNALENAGKYPLVLANCCITGTFSVGTCFGEAWLRAENKGGIGFIGGSDSTYWDEDLWFGNGFYAIEHPNADGSHPDREDTGTGAYDHSFTDANATAASLMVTGNLAVEQSNTSRKLYYWEVYHLFGDPSLQVYWGIPKQNPVEHADTIAKGELFEFMAAAGSYVGLSVDGELVSAGFANEDGVVSLDTSAASGNEAKLVVTAKGRVPYVTTLQIQ